MTSKLKVDAISNAAGTSAISIDSNGVVTRNVLPSFRLSLTAHQNETATGHHIVEFNKTSGDNAFIQGGMTLSGGRVTVPVDGVYQLNTSTRLDNVGSGYVEVMITINGQHSGNPDTYAIDGSPPSNYFTLEPSDIYKLSAGDIVDVRVNSSADTSWRVNASTTFSGALVG